MKDLVEPESNNATITSLVWNRWISLMAVKITGAKSSCRSAPFSSCPEGVVTQKLSYNNEVFNKLSFSFIRESDLPSISTGNGHHSSSVAPTESIQ